LFQDFDLKLNSDIADRNSASLLLSSSSLLTKIIEKEIERDITDCPLFLDGNLVFLACIRRSPSRCFCYTLFLFKGV